MQTVVPGADIHVHRPSSYDGGLARINGLAPHSALPPRIGIFSSCFVCADVYCLVENCAAAIDPMVTSVLVGPCPFFSVLHPPCLFQVYFFFVGSEVFLKYKTCT